MSDCIAAAWDEIAWALGVPLDRGERDALIARYREPHRHYHDGSHIEACLAHLDELRALAARPAEVACAVLFHDAIYQPGRGGDEARSAELARSVLGGAGVDRPTIDRVAAMIEATAGHAPSDDPDRALLLDLDLAILAAAPEPFDRYEDAVRAEHCEVDDAAFARGRSAFVAAMLARPAIYLRAETRARWEERARANLERSSARWR